MKGKKILSVILTVAMLVSMTTFGVAAEGTATEVSSYEALVEALSEGNDVKITDNFTVDTRVTVPDGTTIDLNGKTLNWNVENSYFGTSTIKNGNIVFGKDDVHVCDGYFIVNEGKTLTIDGVNITSSASGMKCYAVFHLKTGAALDIKNSAIDVANNEYAAGYIVYAGEATAKFDLTDSTINSKNVAGVVHAETTITDSSVTIKGTGTMEHGINRSAVTITDSEVSISGGTGRGITAQHGDLVIEGNSEVTVYNMAEATIELRGDKSMTVDDAAEVIVDVDVNNTTAGTVTGTVTVQPVPMGTITLCYTDANSFWGEATSNSAESLAIEIYENETKIASASLNNVGGIIDGDVYVTWHINFGENNDEYWNVEWAEGYPKYDMNPTAVKLFADGNEVAENDVRFNGPDNLNRIVAIAEGFTGDVVAYTTLGEAIGDFNGRKVNVVRDVTESIESFNGCTLTTNVEGGVTVTNTYDEYYVYANDFNIGNGVTVKADYFFYETDGVNTVEGTLEVAETFYHGYNAKTTVDNGGSIAVGGTIILRYNEAADAGLYIYGDGDDSTIEFDCDYYIGAYSGTFYAEDANIETGYFLLKNSYDNETYANIDLTLDNSSIEVVGTTDGQDSFIIDDKASVTLKNGAEIADVRDFNILAGTSLTLSVDGTSKISATNVNIAEGVPFEAVDNGDGSFEIKKILAGQGTQESPYLINNLEDLLIFANNVNSGTTYSGKTVKLTADIDLNNEEWTPIGNSTNKFQGTFDGDNHTISNLLVTGYNSNVGLFGFTTDGEVKNLTVNNAKVSGRLNVGVVAGTPYTSKYTNISVTGHVEVNGMSYVGGVGGKNAYANWTDITVDVDDTSYVKANSVENGAAYRTYVGGVIGFMGEGGHTVKNVTSNIDVYGSTCDVGGIVGIAHYGNNFINCSSSGNVYLEDANESEIGGIAGVWHNGGSAVNFENCSFTGSTYIAGEKVNVAISGPAYGDGTSNPENYNGEREIKGAVTLNGVEKESLAQAIAEAKEMTEPAVIDLLGNNATINKAYVLNNNITFKNGMLIFDDYNGLDSNVYDPAGPYYAVMTIGADVTFDNVILTGKDVKAQQGIFVLKTNGVMSLTNGSELNVTAPTATAVVYSEGTGKLVVNNAKINIDGNGNAVRGMLAVEIDADNAEITVKNITDNAMRNVNGTVDNSVITIDGAEYGIKNDGDCTALAVTDSKITITNTQNEKENAGIYLTAREKLVNTNSIIDAKIFIDVVEGEDVVINTLNFETNGGNAIGSVEKNQGEVVDLSRYTPIKAGYTFVGWYSDEALTQRVTSVTLDAPETVYAKWQSQTTHGGASGVSKYTLTFVTNGGTAIEKISKVKNTVIDLSEYTTRKDGYTFDGWYTDKELSNKVTSIKLIKNTTVYAKWTEIEQGSETEEKNLFADVKISDWFYENVKYAVENSLMNGVAEDKFAPNDTLTRAMLVTVLYRLENEPEAENVSFTDVDAEAYYANAVSWAEQNGIVNGVTKNEFAPNANITREQIATIMYRYAQFKGYDVSASENTSIVNYEDAESISKYAVASMKYVVGNGFVNGKSATTLNPKDNATRAEIAAILQRFIEASKN